MTENTIGSPDLLSIKGDTFRDDHLASLRYAGKIQHALMPDPELLGGILKDYFILFRPRDIVSGDFFYAYYKQGIMCLAAGDCTGHGVPGALLSILGISFLNEIMNSKNSMNANRILNVMREKVMKALRQTGDKAEAKDSIDIGLCLIDCNSGKMQYAGANRPLIRIRKGELTEFKPDLMTIGVAPLREIAFRNNDIDILPGDNFYLFSDGFSDQFGEITNKKLKHKYFKKLLESLASLPMDEQKTELENAFLEWKGSVPQVDDVLIFGFQF
jgi:serine phosphatase RsbU (regulator of sigma subunit)